MQARRRAGSAVPHGRGTQHFVDRRQAFGHLHGTRESQRPQAIGQRLLAQRGIYWKLYQLQYKDQEIASGSQDFAPEPQTSA